MKKIILISLILIAAFSFSQLIPNLTKYHPSVDYDNIHVQKIADNTHQTTFLIWIKTAVALHKHNDHTENVYILEGKGEFTLGDTIYNISSGDYFNIPSGTPHGVTVTSKKPMKVLSIQSPQFDGSDRIPVEKH